MGNIASVIVTVYQLMFSWLPVWFQVVFLGLLALVFVLVVVKVVAIVLDAIPFL